METQINKLRGKDVSDKVIAEVLIDIKEDLSPRSSSVSVPKAVGVAHSKIDTIADKFEIPLQLHADAKEKKKPGM